MPGATYAVSSFHGGEISIAAQGRFDKPEYRFSMKRCLNGFPTEIGNWTRRPGTQYGGHTRGGLAGKVVKFDFEQANAVTLEFTDGYLRFRSGAVLIDTNDSVDVSTVSTANPAVVTLASAVTWSTGDTAMFDGVAPLLQNRQFLLTKVNTTHFSLIDALTNETIDGSTLGTLTTGTIRRVHELATVYLGSTWSDVRAVQAETTNIMLSASNAPQALTVETEPSDTDYAQFAIAEAIFNDGPYLDPFTTGVQATPSAKIGLITLSLSFNTYDATKAYREGDFVTTGGVNYRSLADQNVGNAPASGAPWWTTASVAEAINDGQGFLGSDVGRSIRLYSEPAAWAVGSTYAANAVVSYNPTGIPGATQYWSSIKGSNTGHIPGTDLEWWEPMAGNSAIWSWGRITGLSNIIDRALAGSVNIGDMTSGGGVAAAFNGSFSQADASSASENDSASGLFSSVTLSSYVGKNYSAASDQTIAQATVYPTSDVGFFRRAFSFGGTANFAATETITFNLRGSASAPASPSSGTLLGTSGPIANTFSAVTIVSTDQTTAWKYVWIEMISSYTSFTFGAATFYSVHNCIAQVSFYNPPGTGTGTGVTVELLGPPLLYTAPISTWRLGAYSNTTGWPTCGVYYEGRLWLGGAIKNRFDACVSNGIDGGTIDFAPTGLTGTVSTSNAITYTLNSDSVNQIVDFRADTPGLIACTLAAEHLIVAPTTGPISPLNIAARKVTKFGSESIPAAETEHTRVFVKRFGRKLIDYFADANFNKPAGQNLADKAEHIIASGIAEVAYTSALTPIIWGRDNDGGLFGVTYKRDTMTTSTGPTFAGWHQHSLGTERTVESICIGPSVDGERDTLTMVTNDATTSIRHVEVLTDLMAETAALADAWYLDDAITPSSTSTTSLASAAAPYGGLTINGLWHLNGKTVQVTADGIDCGDLGLISAWSSTKTYAQYEPAKGSDGVYYVSQVASNTGNDPTTDSGTNWKHDFVVTSGSIFVPYGDGAVAGSGRGRFTADLAATANIVVGMTYDSDGQLVRPITPADSGARNGPAFGKLSRHHRYAVSLIGTGIGAIKFGGDLDRKMYPALFKNSRGDTLTDPTESYTGVHQDALQDDYGYDGAPCWRVSRPLPATIAAIASNLSTQDQ